MMENDYILKEHSVSSEMLSGLDKPWNFKRIKKGMSINVVKCDKEEIEFDFVGVSPAIANAFRRILISEVPSMAIEKVMIYNNTTILQDEILAHRLGLIPLKADPRLFEYKSEPDGDPTDQDTLQFELKVKCTRNSSASTDSTDLDDMYINHNVYSRHINWIPLGGQADLYKAEDVGPVHEDILIDKLRPGHELDLKILAVKGIGRDHAKFSPVATASYRLLPEIELLTEVEGDLAVKLQSCFSPGVIGIGENNGRSVAYVKNARYDACSRNVFRYNELKDTVRMGRKKDHFIFKIESVGALPPNDLFLEAIKVLRNKCRTFMEQLQSVD